MTQQMVPKFVKDELLSGETIVWSGQPSLKMALYQGLPLCILGLIATALYLIFHPITVSLNDRLLIMFEILSLWPLAITLSMICSPLSSIQKAKKTYFVLTNHRAIIMSGGSQGTVTSTPLVAMQPSHKTEALGTLTLVWDAEGSRTYKGGNSIQNQVIFFGIEPAALKAIGGNFADSRGIRVNTRRSDR